MSETWLDRQISLTIDAIEFYKEHNLSFGYLQDELDFYYSIAKHH